MVGDKCLRDLILIARAQEHAFYKIVNDDATSKFS